MPTYEENESNNADSRTSQRQRRIYNQYAENLISPEEQKYLSDLKTARATGYFNNTEDTRKAKEEIRRLEAKQDRNLEQLNEIFDQVKTTSTGGGNNNRDVSRANETSMPTFAERGSRGGSLGPTMSEREAAAGLNLAGNNTMSGRGEPIPTMSEREAAAGLNLAGNDPMSGRNFSNSGGGGVDTMSSRDNDPLPVEEPEPEPGTIGVILCVNGSPVSASIYGQIGGTLT